MTVDGALTFLRRWSIVGVLGSAILWISAVTRWSNELFEADFDPARITIYTDHIAFYTGAQLTRFGGEDKLYDYPYVSMYQHNLFYIDHNDHKNDAWTWLEAFRNPPFYAMLYWPTCGWPYYQSAIFWAVASLLLTAVGTYWMNDDQRFWRRFLWVLSFQPTFAAFDYGQNTQLSYFLFAATYALLEKKRPFLAGLVAGFLLFKPQLLLGLGVWALVDIRRKWPCALGVLTTGIALTALSFAVLPTATDGFVKSFNANRQFDSFEQFKMHNPLAMARLLLPPEWVAKELGRVKPPGDEAAFPNDPYYRLERTVRLVHNAIAAGCFLLAAGAFLWLYKHRGNDVHVMFGGAVYLTLWANPHALIYEWMLLAIPGLLWFREWKDRPNTWFVLYALAWGVLYFSTDLNGWLLSHDPVEFCGLVFQKWPITLQWSVPVTAFTGWYAVRLLCKDSR